MSIHSSQAKEPRYTADPRVHIGHVHLKVADLERALSFYAGILGLTVTQRLGEGAAFLAAGDYHHHIAINTWESLGGSTPPPGTTGLYHTAIVYPTRAALVLRLRKPCNASCMPTSHSTELLTTESANPSICAIPTTTESSFTGTSQKTNGHALRMASWKCSPTDST
jgi:hypothetical protein